MYNGDSSTQVSNFFAMSLKFEDADVGDCIQIGGATEKCNHLFSWDSSFQSSSSGLYNALIDVQQANYEFPNGNYEICFGNGDQSDSTSYASIVGDVAVIGLTSEPESNMEVSSDDAQTLQTDFDLTVQSGQYMCTTGRAEGNVNTINVSFTYENGGSASNVANIIAMSIKFASASVGDCIQIGGATEMCNHLFAWGSSLQSNLPGDYFASVDVSSAGYNFDLGDYEMCIGNGDQQDSSSYAGFRGSSEFVGLSTVGEAPTMSPTPHIDTSDSDNDDVNEGVAIGLAVPLGLLTIFCLVYFVWYQNYCGLFSSKSNMSEPLMSDQGDEEAALKSGENTK